MIYLKLFKHFLDCTINKMSPLIAHQNYRESKPCDYMFK
jgi:hypothetical protein